MKKIVCIINLFVICFMTIYVGLATKAEVISVNNSHYIIKEINFKAGELDANKVLLGYVKEVTPTIKYGNQKIALGDVIAYKVDLNDDGIKEIVGIINSSAFCGNGSHGCHLFILHKKNEIYKNISEHGLFWQSGLKISNKKTNGFHNIIIKSSYGDNIEISYKNQYGCYSYK